MSTAEKAGLLILAVVLMIAACGAIYHQGKAAGYAEGIKESKTDR